MRFGIVVFPGSNCDIDCYHAAKEVLGQPTEYVWHQESDLARFDCIVLPGGFSYGDYLRTGALARFSPVMTAVAKEASRGKLILGICNGFQILLEAGLLPGAMQKNDHLQFRCEMRHVRLENVKTPFTTLGQAGQVLRLPIAHAEGNYFIDELGLEALLGNDQVVFRYTDKDGRVTAEANPNGSLHNIAGIVNRAGNVLGIMPHPERSTEEIQGGTDGLLIWTSLLAWWGERHA
ncbi:MAG: phosphoribosylformylglycinamidine synthase subunit PurQ [Firmicutes bacterium]|nr:phosphoribosylformylglycinamidine synthase subunit PurQ [Dethiobacter sp.]MBS3888966.1 phosphoribosylformylglycinamidine synthase subunit PurQ [Bacillota bacterium]MBS4054372.1 phosphoribosylformylglycinamidine synthase subunit PurQ [Thermaerobacter sp.]